MPSCHGKPSSASSYAACGPCLEAGNHPVAPTMWMNHPLAQPSGSCMHGGSCMAACLAMSKRRRPCAEVAAVLQAGNRDVKDSRFRRKERWRMFCPVTTHLSLRPRRSVEGGAIHLR